MIVYRVHRLYPLEQSVVDITDAAMSVEEALQGLPPGLYKVMRVDARRWFCGYKFYRIGNGPPVEESHPPRRRYERKLPPGRGPASERWVGELATAPTATPDKR